MALTLNVVVHCQCSHLVDGLLRKIWPPVDHSQHRVELLDLVWLVEVLVMEQVVGLPPVVPTDDIDWNSPQAKRMHFRAQCRLGCGLLWTVVSEVSVRWRDVAVC